MAVILKDVKAGKARRRLYKPDRDHWAEHKDGRRYFDTARAKAWKPSPGTKLTEADLSQYEAELGVRAVGQNRYHMRVGRILDYDRVGNRFRVVGKPAYLDAVSGKYVVDEREIVERWLPGHLVAAAIISARTILGASHLERGAGDVGGVGFAR